MSKRSEGSLGDQMMKALQGIFRPGVSRHQAKNHQCEAELITGINTMRCMSADVHPPSPLYMISLLVKFSR